MWYIVVFAIHYLYIFLKSMTIRMILLKCTFVGEARVAGADKA